MVVSCTSVETEESLVPEHLFGTIEAVLIHELSHKGASGSLVLHSCLHQIDGVHRRGTRGWKHKAHEIIQPNLKNI